MEDYGVLNHIPTYIRCPYRAKTKDQHEEPKKWPIRREVVKPETQNTNNYWILNSKRKHPWLNKGVGKAKI